MATGSSDPVAVEAGGFGGAEVMALPEISTGAGAGSAGASGAACCTRVCQADSAVETRVFGSCGATAVSACWFCVGAVCSGSGGTVMD